MKRDIVRLQSLLDRDCSGATEHNLGLNTTPQRQGSELAVSPRSWVADWPLAFYREQHRRLLIPPIVVISLSCSPLEDETLFHYEMRSISPESLTGRSGGCLQEPTRIGHRFSRI